MSKNLSSYTKFKISSI